MTVKLRDKVEDTITGYRGTVVAKAEYLNGCIRFGVQPTVTKEGELPDWQWMDEQHRNVIEKRQQPAASAATGDHGGARCWHASSSSGSDWRW